jgi:CRP-like cAMP-binding protein
MKRISLFQGLGEDALGKVVACMKKECYKSGTVIFREDSPGNCLYILMEGTVQVSKSLTLKVGKDSFEDKNKLFNTIDAAGWHPFFGEVALVDESPRTATVTAVSDCTLMALYRPEFEELCRSDSALGYRLMYNICVEICGLLRRHSMDVLKLTTALSLALNR